MTNVNAILLNVANSNLYTFNGETAIINDAEDFDTVTWELEGYTLCEYCGEYVSEDETTYIENYGYVCRNCLADNFAICENCGDWFSNEQLQTVIDAEGNELLVCRNCAVEVATTEEVDELEGYISCEHCGGYHAEEEMIYLEAEDGYICKECFEKNFTACDICEEFYHNEDLQVAVDAEGNELLVCRSCAEAMNRASDDDARTNHYMYCVSGYRTCAHCGKEHLREDVRYFWGFGFICKDCLNIFFAAGDSDSTLIKG